MSLCEASGMKAAGVVVPCEDSGGVVPAGCGGEIPTECVGFQIPPETIGTVFVEPDVEVPFHTWWQWDDAEDLAWDDGEIIGI